MADSSAAGDDWRPDDTFVPVDRRWAGLDRDTIKPSLIVIGALLLLTVVLPGIASSLEFDNPIVEGDRMHVRGATFMPPEGWGIVSGLRDGESSSGLYVQDVVLERGSVSVEVESGSFDGTPEALLEEVRDTNDAVSDSLNVVGDPVAINAVDGTVGSIARFAGPGTGGIIAAFVFDDRGITLVATGPEEDLDRDIAEDVAQMLVTMQPAKELG